MKKNKFRRCLICKKKAIWFDGPKVLFFCQEHSEKFSKFLNGKLPNHSGWMPIRDRLGQKFVRLQLNKIKKIKNKI